MEVCRKVGSPRVKIVYDIYHVQIMDGDIVRNMRDNLDYICHIHVAGVPSARKSTTHRSSTTASSPTRLPSRIHGIRGTRASTKPRARSDQEPRAVLRDHERVIRATADPQSWGRYEPDLLPLVVVVSLLVCSIAFGQNPAAPGKLCARARRRAGPRHAASSRRPQRHTDRHCGCADASSPRATVRRSGVRR